MTLSFLGNLLGKGPLNTDFVDASLALMIVAIGIWVMEFRGWTISLRGIKRNGVNWGSREIALVAVSAALYIAGRPLQLQLIPGIGGIQPSYALAPVLVALFGLPGAVGCTFSMPIGDAISGSLTLGSVAGCLGTTFVTWMVYKFCHDASLRTVRSWIGLYAGIIIGPALHAIVVPGWLDFTHVLPPVVDWSGVPIAIVINQIITPAILAPILLYTLYPSVKQAGLYWRDTLGAGSFVTGRLAAMRAAMVTDPTSSLVANGAVSPADGAVSPADGAVSPADGAVSPADGPTTPTAFEVRDLWLAYPTANQPSLRGITLRAGQGEFIGITGPSGAGKSTLLACLAGLVPRSVTAETSGTVQVLGQEVLAGTLGMAGSRVGRRPAGR